MKPKPEYTFSFSRDDLKKVGALEDSFEASKFFENSKTVVSVNEASARKYIFVF